VDALGDGPHNRRMDTAFISAFSALAGSVVGGLTSGVTTWMSLRSQARAGQRVHNMAQREELYRDFIVAASTSYGNALINDDPQVQEVVKLHGLISRMRVLSTPSVVASAEQVANVVLDTFFGPNKTLRELHELMKSGQQINPLLEFSRTTREELRTF
jgi:hypothetical protein